jgi:quinol monooxygenase YgiN
MILALGDIYAQIPRREEVRELMLATQARIRQQPGCVSYVFAETLEDPGHFVVTSQWRDRAALDEHYRSAPFVEYQAQIEGRLVRTSELRVHTVGESVTAVESSPRDAHLDD